MEWHGIIALVIAIPVIILPAVFIWYINIGGIVSAVKEAGEKQMTRQNTDNRSDEPGLSTIGRAH